MQHRHWAIVGAATAGLVASVLASTPLALAASGTFTQQTPIVGNHVDNDVDGDVATGFAVPDGSGSGSSSISIEAPSNALTTFVDASVDVDHPSMDDLDLVLVAPGGKAMTLASDIGGDKPVEGRLYFRHDSYDFKDDEVGSTGDSGRPVDYDTTPGDVDAHPGNPLPSFEAFGGAPANGSWTLYAYDDTTGNAGQIDGWELEVHYGLSASPSPSSPTPSSILVSGLPKGTTDVNLVLNDLSGYFGYTELVLESPSGRRAHVLSDSMDDGALTAVDLVLDDEARLPIPRSNMPLPGAYRPRNYDNDDQNEWVGGGETIDMAAALSVFDGADPNGTWKLYVHQEYRFTAITIGSWGLELTTGDLPTAPAVTSPSTGARVADDTVTLTGTAGAGAVVRVAEGGTTRSTVAEGGSWSLTRSGLADGSHTFAVTQTDGAGNTSPAVSVAVVVDTKAPKVAKAKPKDGAKGVSISVSPKATFSEVMDASSLKKNVKLTNASGKSVQARLTWNATTSRLTVNPKKDLAGHAAYTLTVKRGASDLAGNHLAKTKKIGFTTR